MPTATAVRALIARLVLGDPPPPARLGSVELRAHQAEAVARIRAALRELGGALLADEVGTGKTFTAVAIAREFRRPLIVGPAAVRDDWARACLLAAWSAPFVSFERLGHGLGPPPGPAPDLVIVDEAHHARNPATRRYRALARLTSAARVLLLSATPIHNRAADLTALLALFLGTRAVGLPPHELARCIIRRARRDEGALRLPAVEPVVRLAIPHDGARLDALLSLPPPLPAADASDGGALLAFGLLRQWASSQGALRGALQRRLATAAALESALASGRRPTRAELAAWSTAEDVVQLAFPELMAAAPVAGSDLPVLMGQLRAHAAAVRALARDLDEGADLDDDRAASIRQLRARHPDEKIVVFTQFAETVHALWRRLRTEPGVAAITADGARVAGGFLRRRDALDRFSPRARGGRPPSRAERVDLLLTTDLLSEGVNLQDASIVVHADLPWTPARLEQRVGRIARLGSPHERVRVYELSPPAAVEALLGVERRLREKLRLAARTVGVAGAILPSLLPVNEEAGEGTPAVVERMRAVLRGWHGSVRPGDGPAAEGTPGAAAEWAATPPAILAAVETPIAAVRSAEPGFLAVIGARDPLALTHTGARTRLPELVASLGGRISADPALVSRAVLLAEGAPPVPVPTPAVAGPVITRIDAWIAAREAAAGVEPLPLHGGRTRRLIARRIASVLTRAPPHLRPLLAPLAEDARRAADARVGAGGELVLGQLATAPMPDEAWLRALAAFAAAHGRHAPEAGNGRETMVLALLLLQP